MNEAIVYRTRNFQADFVPFTFELLTMSMVLMVTKLLLHFIPEILDHQHQKLLVHEEILDQKGTSHSQCVIFLLDQSEHGVSYQLSDYLVLNVNSL